MMAFHSLKDPHVFGRQRGESGLRERNGILITMWRVGEKKQRLRGMLGYCLVANTKNEKVTRRAEEIRDPRGPRYRHTEIFTLVWKECTADGKMTELLLEIFKVVLKLERHLKYSN